MFNYDCVSFSSSIVNVPYVIILSVSICISSLLVWISINTFKTHSPKKFASRNVYCSILLYFMFYYFILFVCSIITSLAKEVMFLVALVS